jgi:hypothetical protein
VHSGVLLKHILPPDASLLNPNGLDSHSEVEEISGHIEWSTIFGRNLGEFYPQEQERLWLHFCCVGIL